MHINTFIRRESVKLTTTKFGLKKLETVLHRVVQNIFRYFKAFRRG